MTQAVPAKGRKPWNDQSLLMAMADLDLTSTSLLGVRELATKVVNMYPSKMGAGMDNRLHVVLPDGSFPSRKGLIDRITAKYESERDKYCVWIALEYTRADRFRKRAEEILSKPTSKSKSFISRPNQNDTNSSNLCIPKKLSPAYLLLIKYPPTNYGQQLIQKTIRSCRKRMKSTST